MELTNGSRMVFGPSEIRNANEAGYFWTRFVLYCIITNHLHLFVVIWVRANEGEWLLALNRSSLWYIVWTYTNISYFQPTAMSVSNKHLKIVSKLGRLYQSPVALLTAKWKGNKFRRLSNEEELEWGREERLQLSRPSITISIRLTFLFINFLFTGFLIKQTRCIWGRCMCVVRHALLWYSYACVAYTLWEQSTETNSPEKKCFTVQ